ncbi:MAG: hypothetical protein M3077_06615 [Candidatus Dormibacteraeota bacterium]|nr:hypothetical protein [Candidatus Dormibacteraeota bacterium]
MYARVVSVRVAAEKVEDMLRQFRGFTASAPTRSGGVILVNRETGDAMTVGFYATEADLKAVLQSFNRPIEVPGEVPGTRSLEIYEVAEFSAVPDSTR